MLRTGEDGGVTVAAGRSNFRLQTLPEGDFPDLTAGEFTHSFTVPAHEFARLIERTAFAISTEETQVLPQRHLRPRHRGDAALRGDRWP